MYDDPRWADTVVGLATLGGALSGVAAVVAALVAFLEGEYQAVGLCLVAAALAFGLLANALLRD
jgi:hypothetical protein